MEYLPIFYDIRARECLVIGAGEVALRKIESLRKAQAHVVVVAKAASAAVHELAETDALRLILREFTPEDLSGKTLAIAATSDDSLNREIAAEASRRNVPVNVVDQPELCRFIMPSIVDRSPVIIAVSTGGAAPVLARLLRARLETMIPAAYGRLAELMRDFRDHVRQRLPNPTARRRFWENAVSGTVAERIFEGKHAAAIATLEDLLAGNDTAGPKGEVYLVGGGPGDPDLLTFRALRLMQQADVVVYDRLVASEIVALCRKDAERIFVGKQRNNAALDQASINELLVRLARQGKRVLRLKGGDPFLFGRGGEEIETLAANSIPFQIVPGITAANGCAAYAGIPLTHRDFAQQCLFVTGHQKDGKTELPWASMIQPQQTIAIYMGLHNIEQVCSDLQAHGLAGELPAAVIERGTTPQQRVLVANLATIAAQAKAGGFASPSLIIVGEVVRLREQLAWFEAS